MWDIFVNNVTFVKHILKYDADWFGDCWLGQQWLSMRSLTKFHWLYWFVFVFNLIPNIVTIPNSTLQTAKIVQIYCKLWPNCSLQISWDVASRVCLLWQGTEKVETFIYQHNKDWHFIEIFGPFYGLLVDNEAKKRHSYVWSLYRL